MADAFDSYDGGLSLVSATEPNPENDTHTYPSNDELFAPYEIVTEDVPLAPWRTGFIRIKALDAAEKLAYQNQIVETIKERNGVTRTQMRRDIDTDALIIIYAAVTPDGSARFHRDQLKMFKSWPGGLIARLSKVAYRLGGIIEDAEREVAKEAFE